MSKKEPRTWVCRRRLDPSLAIVTGADTSHAWSLLNLLNSIACHEPDVQVIAYDLGLTPYERGLIEALHPQVLIKAFDFSAFPDYFNIRVKRGEYAWKPVIVWTELQAIERPLLWMDAGNLIHAPLREAREWLGLTGFYARPALRSLFKLTHRGMMDFLNVSDDWIAADVRVAASAVGFDPGNAAARQLAQEWAHYAQIKACIAPEGSDRSNHRQDQSLISILAYKYELGEVVTQLDLMPRREWPDEFSIHNDIDGRKRQLT